MKLPSSLPPAGPCEAARGTSAAGCRASWHLGRQPRKHLRTTRRFWV